MTKRSKQSRKNSRRSRSRNQSWMEVLGSLLGCKRSLFSKKKSNTKWCKLWKNLKKTLNKPRFWVKHKIGNQKGFSLLEILIVIVILGILVVIGLNSFRTSQSRSRDAKRKAEISQLSRALEMFYQDKRVYPDSDGEGRIQLAGMVLGWGEPFVDPENPSTVYMSKLPEEGCYYESVNEGRGYVTYALLENKKDSDIKGYYQKECADSSCSYNYVVTDPNTPLPTPMPEPEPPSPTNTPAPTTEPTATPIPSPTCPPDPQNLACDSSGPCIECYGAEYWCFADRCQVAPTPTPTIVCHSAPTSQYCDSDGDCAACYGSGYRCSWNYCQPTYCPPSPQDYDCNNDQQCVECYGTRAKCVYDAFCGIPTSVGDMCWDDFDCFPGETCVAGMCQ